MLEWAKQGVACGAGEILITSVDKEGTRKGFDVALVQAVTNAVSVPVIASGGMGTCDDLKEVAHVGGADAVAMADILHYKRIPLKEIRKFSGLHGIKVRSHEHEGSCCC